MAKRSPSVNLSDCKEAADLVKSARARIGHTRFMPNQKEQQDFIGDLLINWAKKDTSLDIDDFFAEKEIGPMRFYNACEDNPYLAECLGIALAYIGNRMRRDNEHRSDLEDSFEYRMKMAPNYQSLMRLEKAQKLQADKQRKEDTKFEVTVNRG